MVLATKVAESPHASNSGCGEPWPRPVATSHLEPVPPPSILDASLIVHLFRHRRSPPSPFPSLPGFLKSPVAAHPIGVNFITLPVGH